MNAVIIYRTQEQLDQLKTAAINDGYKEDSFILYNVDNFKHLGSIGARFRSLNDFVESNPATTVYVWDMATISRKYGFVIEFIERLTSKGIPLVIPKDRFTNLNEDGSENPDTKLFLSILGAIAENELQIRKERQKEGRERSKCK